MSCLGFEYKEAPTVLAEALFALNLGFIRTLAIARRPRRAAQATTNTPRPHSCVIVLDVLNVSEIMLIATNMNRIQGRTSPSFCQVAQAASACSRSELQIANPYLVLEKVCLNGIVVYTFRRRTDIASRNASKSRLVRSVRSR